MSRRGVCVDEAASEVLSYWFDGDVDHNYRNKWFVTGSRDMQAELDRSIADRFGALLKAAMELQLESWRETQEGKIALIIILDQFSRHIFRHQQQPPDAEQRRICDQHALSIAEELTSSPSWHVSLSVSEFVFSLMPYRHTATLQRLESVLQCIDAREAVEAKHADLLLKFRKQTTRRLQLLQDRATIESYDGILERHEMQTDESTLPSESLVGATRAFLRQRGVIPGADVAVSLSGGVDSMVILKILVHLRSELSLRRILAIHIDYSNRPESALEADFLESYCHKYNVLFFKRVVDEVKRGITDRAEYEKVTRQIRYSFYADIFRITAEDCTGSPCSAVMFGHHQGDVQENVISNIMRGCSPLFLAGMNEVGVTENITVWRPLLAFHKTSIYDFAHRYGVPYFRDTTPSWSTRGKLRNMLVPLLVDMYGEGCLRNISSLAAESDETRDMVHQNLYAPFLATVQRHVCGIVVNVDNYKTQPLCFWKLMLKELMHSMSMSLIRERAVANFLERLQMDGCYGSWIELRKGYASYLDTNGDLMLFRDGVLVYTDDRIKSNDGDTVASYPLESDVVSGMWRIVSRIIRDNDVTVDKVLSHPRELMNGSFEYTLQTTASALKMARLHGIRKKGLYPSLSSVDPKIQKELNFLIPDEGTCDDDAPLQSIRIQYNFICNNNK